MAREEEHTHEDLWQGPGVVVHIPIWRPSCRTKETDNYRLANMRNKWRSEFEILE